MTIRTRFVANLSFESLINDKNFTQNRPTQTLQHNLAKIICKSINLGLYRGVPNWIRTNDLSIRNRMLYPAEL